MLDLSSFSGRTSNKYVVNKKTDDSGDRPFHYYDILAIMPYGERTICEGLDNPHDAQLFAMAPEMVGEIIELRNKVEELERCINAASTALVKQ